MECEEGQPREDVDTGAQAAPPFWQRIGPRAVALLALIGTAAAVFLTQHWHSQSEFRHQLTETQPTTGYAIETTATKAAPAVNRLVPEVSPTATAPITVDMIASPPRSVTDQPAALELTTKPAGATFALYPGTIADEAAPASEPLRTGTSPGTAEDLREGNYTIFFHKEGWPDSRTEVQLQAGEVRPVEYAFFHGEVTITSVPNGAEILCGTVSLGFTPLAVALPAGNQVLTARLKNYPDRTQNVAVDKNATPTIEFQMRVRRHIAKAKPTPPPSLIGKVGDSLKHLFGGSPTPTPHRKR
jgi:PEGA domain-containing protein